MSETHFTETHPILLTRLKRSANAKAFLRDVPGHPDLEGLMSIHDKILRRGYSTGEEVYVDVNTIWTSVMQSTTMTSDLFRRASSMQCLAIKLFSNPVGFSKCHAGGMACILPHDHRGHCIAAVNGKRSRQEVERLMPLGCVKIAPKKLKTSQVPLLYTRVTIKPPKEVVVAQEVADAEVAEEEASQNDEDRDIAASLVHMSNEQVSDETSSLANIQLVCANIQRLLA